MGGQSEDFVSPLRWLDGGSGAKAGSRRDESHLPVELSPGTSSSVSRGFATTVPLPTLPEHWKEKPTPVNDLVLALEDMEKTCTTECFNEACYCMSLTRLQDHPPYRDWTRDKGRAQCFERVRKCLEYQYNLSPNRSSASSSFAPRLETILRRSRAWLDLVQDRSSASETRFNRSPGDRLSHSPHGSPNIARNKKSFQSEVAQIPVPAREEGVQTGSLTCATS